MINLDYEAAAAAEKMVTASLGEFKNDAKECSRKAKDLENLITKSLGVLQQQGIYALVLYLGAQKANGRVEEKKFANVILKKMTRLVISKLQRDSNTLLKPDAVHRIEEVLEFYREQVCSDLEQMLLVKDAMEQVLIYGRYSAKAARRAGRGE